MKKSLGAETLVYPTPTWVVGTYDARGKAEPDDGGLGRDLLLRSALHRRLAAQGHLLVRQHRRAQGVHDQRPFRGPGQAGRLHRPGHPAGLRTSSPPPSSRRSAANWSMPLTWPNFRWSWSASSLHQFEIGLHTQFVGEIMDVKAEESVLGDDGLPRVEKVRPIVFAPFNHTYHAVGEYLGEAFALGKNRLKSRVPIPPNPPAGCYPWRRAVDETSSEAAEAAGAPGKSVRFLS